jgi:glycine cleavage system H protein
MSKTPVNLKYTKSHEWVKTLPDGSVQIGITDHAQELLGDLVCIELPAVGKDISAGKECAVVESVKAASDVYAPVSGKVLEVNRKITDAPETLNKDAYGDGWMFRLQPASKADVDKLLDAKAYEAMVAAESH